MQFSAAKLQEKSPANAGIAIRYFKLARKIVFFFRFHTSLFQYRAPLSRFRFLPIHRTTSGKALINENAKENVNFMFLHGDKFTNHSNRQSQFFTASRLIIQSQNSFTVWRFAANQFAMASSPLRLMTSIFFN
jgi:hypothetical protein